MPGEKEIAPNQEPVTWLDDTGDVNAKEIDWAALIPEDLRPDVLLDQYSAGEISDDDPRTQQLLDKLNALRSQAPVVPALEGQRVKLPGFVVPLEMDATKIDQFLLAPSYGACIHVPPPPANQTIHVLTREGKAFEGQLFDTVWVTGSMRVERLSSVFRAIWQRRDIDWKMPAWCRTNSVSHVLCRSPPLTHTRVAQISKSFQSI